MTNAVVGSGLVANAEYTVVPTRRIIRAGDDDGSGPPGLTTRADANVITADHKNIDADDVNDTMSAGPPTLLQGLGNGALSTGARFDADPPMTGGLISTLTGACYTNHNGGPDGPQCDAVSNSTVQNLTGRRDHMDGPGHPDFGVATNSVEADKVEFVDNWVPSSPVNEVQDPEY
jgi:hypothetical protein